MPEELRMDVHDIVQEAVIKIIPKKKKCKKAKSLPEEALQTSEKRRKVKGKGHITPVEVLQGHLTLRQHELPA